MTLPPFLVPRGMDWDPIKKRFFKKLPAQAKVENVDLSSSQKIQKKDKAEHLKSLQPSSIDAKPSRSSLGQSLTTYNSAPNHLLTQQRRRAAIQTSLGHAKHVSTTLIIPWARQGQDVNSFPNSDGCVTLLHSMPALGSIMCLSNKDRTPFFLDTSHVTQLESSSAETLLFSLLGAVNIVTEYSDIRSLSDRLFFNMGSEGEANNITSFKGDYAASVWGGFLNFGRLSNRDSQSKKSPCIKRIFQARISKKDHQYDHLCFQILRSADLTLEEEECFLAYAVQREVTVIYVKYSGDANTPENDKPPLVILALQIMESDITAIQFLPSGIVLLVGLRNGTILYFSTREFLEKKGPKIRDISTASSQKLPVFGEGAVTHIQAVSDHEIVIAYSSGEMFLVDPASRDEPIVCFHGHINSWSLNLVSLVYDVNGCSK